MEAVVVDVGYRVMATSGRRNIRNWRNIRDFRPQTAKLSLSLGEKPPVEEEIIVIKLETLKETPKQLSFRNDSLYRALFMY